MWKRRVGVPPHSRTRGDIAPSPSRARQLPSHPQEGVIGQFQCFSELFAAYMSLGEAGLQRCVATAVVICFGGGKKPTPRSGDGASCWSGAALRGGKRRGPDAAERAQEVTAATHIGSFPRSLQRVIPFACLKKDLRPNWK